MRNDGLYLFGLVGGFPWWTDKVNSRIFRGSNLVAEKKAAQFPNCSVLIIE